MIDIYTDGACEPNPGIGGWGFIVFRDGVEVADRSGGDLATTNNVMEMTAVLCALEYAKMAAFNPEAVKIHSDSQYVVKGCNEWRHAWQRKGWTRGKSSLANVGLWQAIAEAHDTFPCKIEWVKGHCGIPGNEAADAIAEKARARICDREQAREAAQ